MNPPKVTTWYGRFDTTQGNLTRITGLAFVFSVFMELGTGLTRLVTHQIGSGSRQDAAQTLGQALILCFVLSLPVALIGGPLAPALLALAGGDPAVVSLGAPYLALACFASFILALPFVLNASSRAAPTPPGVAPVKCRPW